MSDRPRQPSRAPQPRESDDRPAPSARRRSGPSREARSWARQLTALGHVGMMFPVAIAIGFGGGFYVDRWLGTAPWLALTGFGMGVIAAMRNVVRSLAALERAEAELAAEADEESEPSRWNLR